jgi:hypothetical protein
MSNELNEFDMSHVRFCGRPNSVEQENDIREGCSEEISEGGLGGREGHSEGRSEDGFSDGIIHIFHSEGSIRDDSDGIADAVGQDVVVRDY